MNDKQYQELVKKIDNMTALEIYHELLPFLGQDGDWWDDSELEVIELLQNSLERRIILLEQVGAY